jgi:type IX secretion system PorP/SprF family membrane protein
MGIKKLTAYFVISLFLSFSAKAQQDSQYTNYMYNTMNINPAYAGSREGLSIFGLHRSQWIGLEGAPTTSTLAGHLPVRNSNVGLGFTLMNDEIGPSQESMFSADFSYTLSFPNGSNLAFGLRGTAHLLNVDFTKLNQFNPSDPTVEYNIDNKFSPNVGAGFYWYTEDTYVGLSVPNILRTQHFDKGQANYSSSSIPYERMHFHMIAGHVMDLSKDVRFKPATLVKVVEGSPLQLDLSANFLFYDRFTLGAAYRLDAAFSALAGFQINSNWLIGFGYDEEVTNLANYNSGSFEFFLRYEISRIKQVFSPRFF